MQPFINALLLRQNQKKEKPKTKQNGPHCLNLSLYLNIRIESEYKHFPKIYLTINMAARHRVVSLDLILSMKIRNRQKKRCHVFMVLVEASSTDEHVYVKVSTRRKAL